MGQFFLIVARALIAAPFLVSALLAGLAYTETSAAFAQSYPQFEGAYPLVIGLKALLGLILILGLPTHKTLAALLAVVVVAMAVLQAPFWHFIGEDRVTMMALFTTRLAQAGGLLMIAALPRR